MRNLLLAAAALTLAGCHDHVSIARPADVYLTCADEPAIPIGPPEASGFVTDGQNAAYIRDMRAAWQDCRSKNDYLRDWFARLRK